MIRILAWAFCSLGFGLFSWQFCLLIHDLYLYRKTKRKNKVEDESRNTVIGLLLSEDKH